MKKLFSNLIRAGLVLLVLTGCKDENPAAHKCYMLSETSEYDRELNEDYTSMLLVEYDADHALSAIVVDHERMEVELDDHDNVVTMVNDFTSAVTTFQYDAEDRLRSTSTETMFGSETYTYEYGETGQLTKTVWAVTGFHPTVWEYTYEYPNEETKNPSGMTATLQGTSLIWIHEFTYDDHPVPTGSLNRLLFDPLNPAQNNVTWSSISTSGVSAAGLIGEFTYSYNENGYPQEVTATYSNGDEAVLTYSYECE